MRTPDLQFNTRDWRSPSGIIAYSPTIGGLSRGTTCTVTRRKWRFGLAAETSPTSVMFAKTERQPQWTRRVKN